jgi:hypothetical protein
VNAGDAKAVLARSTSTDGDVVDKTKSQLKAIVLTREHKAIFPQERSRIQKVICLMLSFRNCLFSCFSNVQQSFV